MHRFQPGNENPILNDKLLREAYQAGRQQAINEQRMGMMPATATSYQQTGGGLYGGNPVSPSMGSGSMNQGMPLNRTGMNARGRGMNTRGRGMGTPDERALVISARDILPADLGDQWEEWLEHGDGTDDRFTPFGKEKDNKRKGQHFSPGGFQYRPVVNHPDFPDDVVYNSEDGQWYFIPGSAPTGNYVWDGDYQNDNGSTGRWVKGSPPQG